MGSQRCTHHEDHTHHPWAWNKLSCPVSGWDSLVPAMCMQWGSERFRRDPELPLSLKPPPTVPLLGCGLVISWLLAGGLPLGAGSGSTHPQLPEPVHLPSKPQPGIVMPMLLSVVVLLTLPLLPHQGSLGGSCLSVSSELEQGLGGGVGGSPGSSHSPDSLSSPRLQLRNKYQAASPSRPWNGEDGFEWPNKSSHLHANLPVTPCSNPAFSRKTPA